MVVQLLDDIGVICYDVSLVMRPLMSSIKHNNRSHHTGAFKASTICFPHGGLVFGPVALQSPAIRTLHAKEHFVTYRAIPGYFEDFFLEGSPLPCFTKVQFRPFPGLAPD